MRTVKAGQTVQMVILNKAQVAKTFHALGFSNSVDKTALRELVKAEIITMRNMSKANLVAQGSFKTGALLGSFSTTSRSYVNNYVAKFGSRSTYAYAIDQGTKRRGVGTDHYTGAVGAAETNYKGRNYSFTGMVGDKGFANRAINEVIPGIEGRLAKGIDKIIQIIILRNKL